MRARWLVALLPAILFVECGESIEGGDVDATSADADAYEVDVPVETRGDSGIDATDADTMLHADSDSGAAPDARDSYDPTCHYDCFGRIECSDGGVTVWANAPIPCWEWKGSCPIAETFPCVKGCRTDDAAVPFGSDPHEACEEGRPKKVGDPCAAPSDCLPTPAIVTGPDTVENTYLACDADAGTCVAIDPPVVVDWLALCGAIDLSTVPTGAYGFVDAPDCSGGYCLIAPDTTASPWCTAEGCTIACAYDWDCPPDSVCETSLHDWAPGDAAIPTGVCKPGPHGLIGLALACPPAVDAGDAADAGDSSD